MDVYRFIPVASIAIAAALLGAHAHADVPDWKAIGREMAEASESVRPGESQETGLWIVAIAPVPEAQGRPDAERLVQARLAAKRALAGFVGGETVAAQESSTMEESSANGVSSVSETFRQRIDVRADAFLRGIQEAAVVQGNGKTWTVLVATERMADAAGALVSAAAQEGPGVVRACGFGAVSDGEGGLAAARKQALASATASAVEMVLGTAIAAREASLDGVATAKVCAGAGGFVKQYRIEAEGEIGGGSYRVAILAEVAKDELLASYESALAAMGDLRFFVEPTGDRALDAALSEKFAAWGCPLTKDRDSASYLVRCEGAWTPVTHPADGSDGWRLSCTVRVLDAATGSELLCASNDPTRAVDFAGSDDARKRDRATDKAMREIHGKLHKGLDRMIGRMVATGREVRLVFDNYSAAFTPTLEEIVACISRVPGCQSPSIRADASTGTAVVTLRCQLDMDSLRKFVDGEMERSIPASSRPDTVSFDSNTWQLSW